MWCAITALCVRVASSPPNKRYCQKTICFLTVSFCFRMILQVLCQISELHIKLMYYALKRSTEGFIQIATWIVVHALNSLFPLVIPIIRKSQYMPKLGYL